MIKQILYIAIVLVVIVSGVYLVIHNSGIKDESKALYEKSHLTVEDLETEASFSACSVDETDDGSLVVKYKKLYGIVPVDTFKVSGDGGIDIEVLNSNVAKILILDKAGNEVFYEEVSEEYFEPGKSGKYDVYLVGNKFTGKIQFKSY